MTVTTNTNKVQHLGNGSTTAFPYSFRIYSASDLVVTRTVIATGVDAILVLNTDYTVTGAGSYNGGNVVMTSAPADGTRITILRVLSVTQGTDLRNQGAYFAESHEDVFDRLTMIHQQQQETFDRSLKFPTSDASGAQGEIPSSAARANKLMSFDASGNPTAVAAASQSASELSINLADTDLLKGVALVAGAGRVVNSIAALRALPKTGNKTALVTGYYAAGDGGGGSYHLDPADTTSTDNGGTIIVASDGGRWKLLNQGSLSIKQFGAKGDGENNDTAAFVNWAAALNTAGGVGLIPPGNYRVLPSIGGILCAFADKRISIEAEGATITDGNAYAAGQYATLFEFANCIVTVAKPRIVTQQQDANFATGLGLSAFVFKRGCSLIDVDAEISGGQYGVLCTRLTTDAASFSSRNVKVRLKANNLHYPYTGQFSGDQADVTLDVTACGRNFFIYGVKQNKFRVRSKDQKVTSLIKAYSGLGCDDVTVDYYDRESGSCNSAAPLVAVEWGDSTAASHRNIRINLDVTNPTGAPRGHTVAFAKYSDGATLADTTGRGHLLDGFHLSGTVDNTGTSSNHVWLDAGAFAGTDAFRNIAVENFTGFGGNSSLYIPLQVLADISTWKSVSIQGHIFTNNGGGKKVVFVGCSAKNFTGATSNTDAHDYVACNIIDGDTQNTANNKNFINTTLAGKSRNSFLNSGSFYQTMSAQRIGSQTTVANMFKVPALGTGMFFRLHYFLVYDQSNFDPASRRETSGVKSFSVTTNTTGGIDLQTPVANDVAERTLGVTPAVLSVSLAAGDATGAFIAVSATNYDVANSRGHFVLETIPMAANVVVTPA